MKLILIIAVPLILLAAGGTAFYLSHAKSSIVSPTSQTQVKTEAEVSQKTIEDSWGLKISYPETLTVVPSTPSGALTQYSFSDEKHKGSITISSKETNAETIDDYIAGVKELKDASPLDTTVGGKPGKKMRLTGNSTKVLVVDQGQVFDFTMEPGDGEEAYWNKTYNDVLAKYEFLPFEGQDQTTVNSDSNPDAQQAPADTGGSDVSEETIE